MTRAPLVSLLLLLGLAAPRLAFAGDALVESTALALLQGPAPTPREAAETGVPAWALAQAVEQRKAAALDACRGVRLAAAPATSAAGEDASLFALALTLEAPTLEERRHLDDLAADVLLAALVESRSAAIWEPVTDDEVAAMVAELPVDPDVPLRAWVALGDELVMQLIGMVAAPILQAA